jgi:hypothetical protein
MKVSVLLLVSLTTFNQLSFAGRSPRPDSLEEVFPLGRHLHYLYQYRYEIQYIDMLVPVGGSIDSGLVHYTIVDSTGTNDSSSVWDVQEVKALWHQRWGWLGDTSYSSNDTVALQLQETISGNHEIRILGTVWNFPLGPPAQSIYRYADSSRVQITRYWYQGFTYGSDTVKLSDTIGFFYRTMSAHSGSIQNGTSYLLNVNLIGTPTVGVNEEVLVSQGFLLEQNYPNPFNPDTKIGFRLSEKGFTSLKLYDVLGREVATLVSEIMTAGHHEVSWNARGLPSGVYFARLFSDEYSGTRKLVLLK